MLKKDWKEKERKQLQSLTEEGENMMLNNVENMGRPVIFLSVCKHSRDSVQTVICGNTFVCFKNLLKYTIYTCRHTELEGWIEKYEVL